MSSYPVHAFSSSAEWRSWLAKHHASSNGVWLHLAKKNSKKWIVRYDEALDEALCYGWIDGQLKSHDGDTYLQKFTPRRPKSMWSKRNREHVARLVKEKRMTAAGKKEVDKAKKDGRWEQAYNAPSAMEVPADFLKVLRKDSKAHAFFKTLNKANRYAIAWRLQTAKKAETRAQRMESLLLMMREGRKLH